MRTRDHKKNEKPKILRKFINHFSSSTREQKHSTMIDHYSSDFADLKRECRILNLNVSGNKQELTQRLLDQIEKSDSDKIDDKKKQESKNLETPAIKESISIEEERLLLDIPVDCDASSEKRKSESIKDLKAEDESKKVKNESKKTDTKKNAHIIDLESVSKLSWQEREKLRKIRFDSNTQNKANSEKLAARAKRFGLQDGLKTPIDAKFYSESKKETTCNTEMSLLSDNEKKMKRALRFGLT